MTSNELDTIINYYFMCFETDGKKINNINGQPAFELYKILGDRYVIDFDKLFGEHEIEEIQVINDISLSKLIWKVECYGKVDYEIVCLIENNYHNTAGDNKIFFQIIKK